MRLQHKRGRLSVLWNQFRIHPTLNCIQSNFIRGGRSRCLCWRYYVRKKVYSFNAEHSMWCSSWCKSVCDCSFASMDNHFHRHMMMMRSYMHRITILKIQWSFFIKFCYPSQRFQQILPTIIVCLMHRPMSTMYASSDTKYTTHIYMLVQIGVLSMCIVHHNEIIRATYPN